MVVLKPCMGDEEANLKKLKEEFQKEIEGITDIDELKELFATEIARRDNLLADLQEQNQLILQSTFKKAKDNLDSKGSKSE